MAIYSKRTIGGKWANKSKLFEDGVKTAKIVSETNPQASTYKDEKGNPQEQDVCKVMFQGEAEPLNVALNSATIDGLVSAFGGDSRQWMNHELAVEIDKLPGKKYPLYLIPEGYHRTEDANGYSVIVKSGESEPVINLDEEPAQEDQVPF
jgi:hypothetical protein